VALVLGACVAVIAAALGWVSVTVVRLDEEGSRARRQARLEESVRLALWRMDSVAVALIGRESARPAFGGDLPLAASPEVVARFRLEGRGGLEAVGPDGHGRLAELEASLDRERLWASLGSGPSPSEPAPSPEREQVQADSPLVMKQQAMNVQEFQARSRAAMQAAEPASKGGPQLLRGAAASVGAMRPLWTGEELLLVRPVTAAGREAVEGCWLDWAVLEGTLLAQVDDLLPGSRLEPVRGEGVDAGERRLAALPVRLVPGPLPDEGGGGPSAARLSLLVAWGGTALAALAAVLLVVGVVTLSERRAAFVSAVTHELRTPLTTFRMYTEMLRDGMVPDPERQRAYLTTLAGEAVRLDHLVHNVLAYARLERGRGVGEVERVAVAALLDRTGERLEERARQAGMELEVVVEEEAQDAAVNADSAALERVLFNLVDNACRYAAGADDPRLHLEVAVKGGWLELAVRDHGPGVSPEVARRLFRPFAKSARAAAESAPGVGLGLALSRRLARRMGGDLSLDRHHDGGARFLLRLPVA